MTWTPKTRETNSWDGKNKANVPVDEAHLEIGGGHFLDIGDGNKLIIQPQSNGAQWTPKPKAT